MTGDLSALGFDLLVGGLDEPAHVHVALGAPVCPDDVSEACADEEHGAVAVGEGADEAGGASDLAHDPLDGGLLVGIDRWCSLGKA